MVMLFFGMVGLGISLGRYMQAVHVGRDVAHMYVRGIDFSQTTSKNIVVQLASGTGMTSSGGNGVVILSKISTVYQADCDAAALSSCPNLNQAVFTQRLTIGNSALRTSSFGTPSSSIIGAQGNIAPSVYLGNTDSTVRTSGFSTLMTTAGITQQQGDSASVVEVYFQYPDLSFLGSSTPSGVYVRYIF